MEKWLRFELLRDPLNVKFADNDLAAWFDAILFLLRRQGSQSTPVHLTWGLANLSQLNMLHSLHTLHYDNAAFVRIMDETCQKYPDSFEFPIALPFAGIAVGQFHNGTSQLTSIYVRMPKIYVDVLRYAVSNWVSGSILADIRSYGMHDRAVILTWEIPAGWKGTTDSFDKFADDSLALMYLQPENKSFPNYGCFQSLREHSKYQRSKPRIRLGQYRKISRRLLGLSRVISSIHIQEPACQNAHQRVLCH